MNWMMIQSDELHQFSGSSTTNQIPQDTHVLMVIVIPLGCCWMMGIRRATFSTGPGALLEPSSRKQRATNTTASIRGITLSIHPESYGENYLSSTQLFQIGKKASGDVKYSLFHPRKNDMKIPNCFHMSGGKIGPVLFTYSELFAYFFIYI